MKRFLVAIWMVSLAGVSAMGQQATGTGKTALMERIGLYEEAIRSAESKHAGDHGDNRAGSRADSEALAEYYLQLGDLYEDASMYPKSEDALKRAVALRQGGEPSKLAAAMARLAVLHIAMGDLRRAVDEEFAALKIRQSAGDRIGVAQSWSDIADLYIKQRAFGQAVEYAQKAMTVLGDDPTVSVAERITVRQTLAYALCASGDCAHALPLLKDGIELAKTAYGADSLPVGNGYFQLGYAAWKNGDMEDAADWMQRGTARMRVDLGWGHVLYLQAMQQYARFLRECGQVEAADVAERVVRQAGATVDARSFAGRSGAALAAGQ